MSSTLRDHLQAIYDEFGRLTPDDVLEVARDPTHPLHTRFEWDDSVAAEKYRRDQARKLITSVRVTFAKPDTDDGITVRAWHAVRYTEEGTEPARSTYVYEPAEKVASDPLLAKIVLADMQREWKALRRRYEEYKEFWLMIQDDIELIRQDD